MKYFIVIFLINFSFYTSKASDSLSVRKRPAHNIIKTELTGYINSIKSIYFERVLNEKYSIQVGYAFGEDINDGQEAKDNLSNKTGQSFPNTVQKIKLNHHIKAEFRKYLSYKRTMIPAGFHLGPSIEFNKISESYYNVPDTSNTYGTLNSTYNATIIAFNFGPQLLIKRIVSLDIFVSPGFYFNSGTEVRKYGPNNEFGHTEDISDSGFSISFSVTAGIAFGK